MTFASIETALECPASVPIHHNSNVTREPRGID
jgi:hypothetical protein